MPSNYTPNFNLSQWEKTDKVQMEDFNADNAKLDAALGTALDRAGMRLLREEVLEKQAANFMISVKDFDWAAYSIVCIEMQPFSERQFAKITPSFASRDFGTAYTSTPDAVYRATVLLWLFPMFKANTGLLVSTVGALEDKGYYHFIPYTEAKAAGMTIVNEYSDTYLAPGSTIRIWGMK